MCVCAVCCVAILGSGAWAKDDKEECEVRAGPVFEDFQEHGKDLYGGSTD
jgi:hypothetical protein